MSEDANSSMSLRSGHGRHAAVQAGIADQLLTSAAGGVREVELDRILREDSVADETAPLRGLGRGAAQYGSVAMNLDFR